MDGMKANSHLWPLWVFLILFAAVMALWVWSKEPEPPEAETTTGEPLFIGGAAADVSWIDTAGRIVMGEDSCKLPIPPGKQLLKNTITGKYCIGQYHRGVDVWSYYGGQGYTDTCKLKADYLRAWADETNADERNKYYKPI